MKKILTDLRSWREDFWGNFALTKVYYDRSSQYKNYIKTAFAFFTLIGVYRHTKWGSWFLDNIVVGFLSVALITIIISLIVGKFDKKKIRPREMEEITSTNPHVMEMKADIKKILEKLEKS